MQPATGDRVAVSMSRTIASAGLDPKDPIRVSYGEPIGDEPTGEPSRTAQDGLSAGHDGTISDGISRISDRQRGMGGRGR